MADKTVGQLSQTTDVVGTDLIVIWRPSVGVLKATTVSVLGAAIAPLLGTMAAQNAANVAITGGTLTGVTVSGITPIAATDGGTGANTIGGAQDALGVDQRTGAATASVGTGATLVVPLASGFNVHELDIWNVAPSSEDVLLAELSYDGGSTWYSAAGSYVLNVIQGYGSYSVDGPASIQSYTYIRPNWYMGQGQITTAGKEASYWLRLRLDQAGTRSPQVEGSFFTTRSADGSLFHTRGQGFCAGTGLPTHIRFRWLSGASFARGSYRYSRAK